MLGVLWPRNACRVRELPRLFGVIDLFAGPGGLGEGFACLEDAGHNPFQIEMSIEKEPSANRTLKLRAFLRAYRSLYDRLPPEYVRYHAGQTPEPDWEEVDREAWRRAELEACNTDLGTAAATLQINKRIAGLGEQYDDTILIGGPPCQAYSLVGRARVRSVRGYRPGNDPRYFLYREYVRVLHRLCPAAFVMENVKGMLSATVEGQAVYDMFLAALRSASSKRRATYELYALVSDNLISLRRTEEPRDFVVRCEDFGIPQRRHRLIIVGLRSDVAHRVRVSNCRGNLGYKRHWNRRINVCEALRDLPPLRSGLSKGRDTTDRWICVISEASRILRRISRRQPYRDLNSGLDRLDQDLVESARFLKRSSSDLPPEYGSADSGLTGWLRQPQLIAFAQHETRAHMPADLQRYLFATVFALAKGRSPKSVDFPHELAPRHRNWNTGVFSDRFRVQVGKQPATTVTSHIAKDGHYFIHPSYQQCRSLTVREAARIQTFPDDYLFLGNRTQQYVQVGNAVPPFLALQIAKLVWDALNV